MWLLIISLFQRIPAFSFLFPVAKALMSLLIKIKIATGKTRIGAYKLLITCVSLERGHDVRSCHNNGVKKALNWILPRDTLSDLSFSHFLHVSHVSITPVARLKTGAVIKVETLKRSKNRIVMVTKDCLNMPVAEREVASTEQIEPAEDNYVCVFKCLRIMFCSCRNIGAASAYF